MSSKEVIDLTDLLAKQNSQLESLEKELTDLCVKNKTSQDPNSQLVKQLGAENEQLKYEIDILTSALKVQKPDVGAPAPSNSNNLTFEEKYELISRNLQEIVGADR